MDFDETGLSPLTLNFRHKLQHSREEIRRWRPVVCDDLLEKVKAEPDTEAIVCVVCWDEGIRCSHHHAAHALEQHVVEGVFTCGFCAPEHENQARHWYAPDERDIELREEGEWIVRLPVAKIWGPLCEWCEIGLVAEAQGEWDAVIRRDSEMN